MSYSGLWGTFTNVTHHYNRHHPNVDKTIFYFDNKAKELGIGKYKQYKGFKCCFCGAIRKCFVSHCENKHPEIDVKTPQFEEIMKKCKMNPSSLKPILNSYEHMLTTMGVGKRNAVDPKLAASYRKQVESMIPSMAVLLTPDIVFQNIQEKTKTFTATTKYTYYATLLNFIEFMANEHKGICTEGVERLSYHVKRWLYRQRSAKEKQERFVKEKSRRKLKELDNPYSAILQYEKESRDEILSLKEKRPGSLKKPAIERLYGDIFCRVIFRLGCRSGIFTGMTLAELESPTPTDAGNVAINIEKQKEKNQHGTIVVSGAEYKDLQIASSHAWAWIKKEPLNTGTAPAFPSLQSTENDATRLSSTIFNRIFQQTSLKVFPKAVSATDVRKIITTKMKNQSIEVQRAVARAEGHSLEMADKVYNFSDAIDLVEQARFAMRNVASGESSATSNIVNVGHSVAATSDSVAPTSDSVAATSDSVAPTSDSVAPTSDSDAATTSGHVGGATTSGHIGGATTSGHVGGATTSGHVGGATTSGHVGGATTSGHIGGATTSGQIGAATYTLDSDAATTSGHVGGATTSGHVGGATTSGHIGGATLDSDAATTSGHVGGATTSGHVGGATTSGHIGGATLDSDAATTSGHVGGATTSGHVGGATTSGHVGGATTSGHVGGATTSGHVGGATTSGHIGGATTSGHIGGATLDSAREKKLLQNPTALGAGVQHIGCSRRGKEFVRVRFLDDKLERIITNPKEIKVNQLAMKNFANLYVGQQVTAYWSSTGSFFVAEIITPDTPKKKIINLSDSEVTPKKRRRKLPF
ncbi:uncharacterized protein LOC113475390 [Ciona intestinalis]